jgi:hypothetical protein
VAARGFSRLRTFLALDEAWWSRMAASGAVHRRAGGVPVRGDRTTRRACLALSAHSSSDPCYERVAKSFGLNLPLRSRLSMPSRLCPVSSGIRKKTKIQAATLKSAYSHMV